MFHHDTPRGPMLYLFNGGGGGGETLQKEKKVKQVYALWIALFKSVCL